MSRNSSRKPCGGRGRGTGESTNDMEGIPARGVGYLPTVCDSFITLPITTRGIGMTTAFIFRAAFSHNQSQYYDYDHVPSIYAVYRLALGVLESKLYYTSKRRNAFPYYNWTIRTREEHLWSSLPKPLQRVVNAVVRGFKHRDGGIYFPAMSRDVYVEEKLVPRAENILLSNLRRTVEALADPSSDADVRQAFFDHNSIPGASWSKDYLLQNADDIMPPDYDDNALVEDASFCGDWLMFTLQLYLPNMVQQMTYERHWKGSLSLFVCNDQGNLAIPNRGSAELRNYYPSCCPTGNITEFGEFEFIRKIPPLDAYLGILNLLGERPYLQSAMDSLEGFFSPRDASVVRCAARIVSYLKVQPDEYQPWLMSRADTTGRNAGERRFHGPRISTNHIEEIPRNILPIIVVNRRLNLPITTRGIGMGTAIVYYAANISIIKREIKYPPIYALYRFALGILEAKLNFSYRYSEENPLRSVICEQTENLTFFPKPLQRVVKAAGILEHPFGGNYESVMSRDIYVEGKLVPRAENVWLSNLRKTVEALEDPSTDADVRREFFLHNSIPGASWSEDNLLQNANEIMPPDYDGNAVAEDGRSCTRWLSELERYLPNMVVKLQNTDVMSFKGSLSLCVSNDQETLAIPNRGGMELDEYYAHCQPTGGIERFQLMNEMPAVDIYHGILNLLGERPYLQSAVDAQKGFFTLRDVGAAVCTIRELHQSLYSRLQMNERCELIRDSRLPYDSDSD